LFKKKYLIALRNLISFSFLISLCISQNLNSNNEIIRKQVGDNNREIELAKVKDETLEKKEFKKWKMQFFEFKSDEYYSAKSEYFATRDEARDKALLELSGNIKIDISSSSEHRFEERSLNNDYDIREDYSATSSTTTDEALLNISTIYIVDDDNSYSAFILKHKLEYTLEVKEGLETVYNEAEAYFKKFKDRIDGGDYTKAFKNLCIGYNHLKNHPNKLPAKGTNLLNDFEGELTEFIGKINLESNTESNDDKDDILPFTEYKDFITIRFNYKGKSLKNFPLILKCDNCLVEGWGKNKNAKHVSLDNSRLTIDIESFLTTSPKQKITVYPDVSPIDNADNKFSFNSDVRKKEFNVSDKIIFGEVSILNPAGEPIYIKTEKKNITDECKKELDKYSFLEHQTQYVGPIILSEENVLVLELNEKRDKGLAKLIYRVSGSVKASANGAFDIGYFENQSEKLMKDLIKDLYENYQRNNNFVKVKLSLAENTILKILSPHYNNDLTERKNEITGRNNEIILRKGQKYSFQFLYNSSLGKQVFYTLSDKIFTKKGETLLDPLNEDFRFPTETLKIPIRLKGINNHSLSVYSSENNLPFGGWKLEKAFDKSNDRKQEVKVKNDKKYRITLLKNGYKEYKTNELIYFDYNKYNNTSARVPLIKMEKSDLQRPNSFDYMKYLSIPGIGQREVMHHSKFNWRKFESYILIASSCYLGWELSKAYSTYDDSKRNYHDLQSKYNLLTEDASHNEFISLKTDAKNMYDSMERNHNTLKSVGNTLIALYVFNFADIVFSINFIN
jgi:hypothetical protein